MKKVNFLTDLAEILEVEPTELVDEYLLDGKWNSLAIVATIALIDEQFNVIIPGDDLRGATLVKDLWQLIQNKKM
jgi:acyl carrier protein